MVLGIVQVVVSVVFVAMVAFLVRSLRRANALNVDLASYTLTSYHEGGVAFGNAMAQHAKAEGRDDVVTWMQDFIATQAEVMRTESTRE